MITTSAGDPGPAPSCPPAATTPTRTSSTTVALAVAAVAGLPALIQQINLLDLGLPTWGKNALAVVSVVSLWLAPLLARHSATQAVQIVESKLQTVAETTAAAMDPEKDTTPAEAAETLREVAGAGQ